MAGEAALECCRRIKFYYPVGMLTMIEGRSLLLEYRSTVVVAR